MNKIITTLFLLGCSFFIDNYNVLAIIPNDASTDVVKDIYRSILHAIDTKEVDADEDIFIVKRRYFTAARNAVITEFAHTWFVDEEQLHTSAMQYVIGSEPIPNIGGIIDSK